MEHKLTQAERRKDERQREWAEEFDSIYADLVSRQEYDAWLGHLFLQEADEWVDVFALCGDYPKIGNRLRELEEQLEGQEELFLYAAWLNGPNLSEGFSAVLFLDMTTYRSFVAMFNKQLYLDTHPSIMVPKIQAEQKG